MTRNLRPVRGFARLLLPAVALSLSAAAHADVLAAPTAGLATVRITGAAIEPNRLAIGPEQHFVFQNEVGAMARVELDLEHGTGITCRSGTSSERGRKFVVASGASLECEAPPEGTRYRVYRPRSGGGAPVATEGEVVLESR
jgi:hypothetical protein